MSAEFWAILGMGITILACIAASNRQLHSRIDELSRRIDALNARIDALSARVDDLAQRVSRLAGEIAEMKRWSQDLVQAVLHRPAA